MVALRKHVRKAVIAYFKEQRRKGHKLYEVEEQTHLAGKSEEELLSILENVGGDRDVVLQKTREEVDWAFDAAYDAAFGPRERLESERRAKGGLIIVEQDAFSESLEFQKRLLEKPRAGKESFAKWKT
jgi:hypothetical protein